MSKRDHRKRIGDMRQRSKSMMTLPKQHRAVRVTGTYKSLFDIAKARADNVCTSQQ